MLKQKKKRIHDWHNLKWPFCATFLYYALISLFTGTADASEEGFLAVLVLALIVDAVVYLGYCFFLSKDREDMQKLWFIFIFAYLVLTSEQLGILWQMMQQRAGVL